MSFRKPQPVANSGELMDLDDETCDFHVQLTGQIQTLLQSYLLHAEGFKTGFTGWLYDLHKMMQDVVAFMYDQDQILSSNISTARYDMDPRDASGRECTQYPAITGFTVGVQEVIEGNLRRFVGQFDSRYIQRVQQTQLLQTGIKAKHKRQQEALEEFKKAGGNMFMGGQEKPSESKVAPNSNSKGRPTASRKASDSHASTLLASQADNRPAQKSASVLPRTMSFTLKSSPGTSVAASSGSSTLTRSPSMANMLKGLRSTVTGGFSPALLAQADEKLRSESTQLVELARRIEEFRLAMLEEIFPALILESRSILEGYCAGVARSDTFESKDIEQQGYTNERLRQSSETSMYLNITAPFERAKEIAREQISLVKFGVEKSMKEKIKKLTARTVMDIESSIERDDKQFMNVLVGARLTLTWLERNVRNMNDFLVHYTDWLRNLSLLMEDMIGLAQLDGENGPFDQSMINLYMAQHDEIKRLMNSATTETTAMHNQFQHTWTSQIAASQVLNAMISTRAEVFGLVMYYQNKVKELDPGSRSDSDKVRRNREKQREAEGNFVRAHAPLFQKLTEIQDIRTRVLKDNIIVVVHVGSSMPCQTITRILSMQPVAVPINLSPPQILKQPSSSSSSSNIASGTPTANRPNAMFAGTSSSQVRPSSSIPAFQTPPDSISVNRPVRPADKMKGSKQQNSPQVGSVTSINPMVLLGATDPDVASIAYSRPVMPAVVQSVHVPVQSIQQHPPQVATQQQRSVEQISNSQSMTASQQPAKLVPPPPQKQVISPPPSVSPPAQLFAPSGKMFQQPQMPSELTQIIPPPPPQQVPSAKVDSIKLTVPPVSAPFVSSVGSSPLLSPRSEQKVMSLASSLGSVQETKQKPSDDDSEGLWDSLRDIYDEYDVSLPPNLASSGLLFSHIAELSHFSSAVTAGSVGEAIGIKAGSIIIGINGESVIGMPFTDVQQALLTASLMGVSQAPQANIVLTLRRRVEEFERLEKRRKIRANGAINLHEYNMIDVDRAYSILEYVANSIGVNKNDLRSGNAPVTVSGLGASGRQLYNKIMEEHSPASKTRRKTLKLASCAVRFTKIKSEVKVPRVKPEVRKQESSKSGDMIKITYEPTTRPQASSSNALSNDMAATQQFENYRASQSQAEIARQQFYLRIKQQKVDNDKKLQEDAQRASRRLKKQQSSQAESLALKQAMDFQKKVAENRQAQPIVETKQSQPNYPPQVEHVHQQNGDGSSDSSDAESVKNYQEGDEAYLH